MGNFSSTYGRSFTGILCENGDIIMTKETVNHVADLFEKYGSNIWFEKKLKNYFLKDLVILKP